MRFPAIIAIIIAACAPAFAQSDEPLPATLATSGVIDSGELNDGKIWFTLVRADGRFEMKAGTFDPDAVVAALKGSDETARSFIVHFDPRTATFDPATSEPVYVARDIVYDGKTVTGDTVTPPRDATAFDAHDKAEFALSTGVAFLISGDADRARPFLDTALSSSELSAPQRLLGLRTRGTALAGHAEGDFPVGDERDKLEIAALADFRAWQQSAPNDYWAAYAVGEAYIELGAYDEALDIFTAAYKTWPDDRYRTLLRIGAIQRSKGNDRLALDALNQIAAMKDGPSGMAYHYHRGWTLSNLGHYDEAVAEFSAGISEQPDYSWAYYRRACAYAAQGMVREALADHLRGQDIDKRGDIGGPDSPAAKQNRERQADVAAILTAAANNPHGKIADLCTGYWDGDERRTRSPLLPKTP